MNKLQKLQKKESRNLIIFQNLLEQMNQRSQYNQGMQIRAVQLE